MKASRLKERVERSRSEFRNRWKVAQRKLTDRWRESVEKEVEVVIEGERERRREMAVEVVSGGWRRRGR